MREKGPRWVKGELVRFHNGLNIKRKTGLVLEATESVAFHAGWSYSVFWNSGLVSLHSGWELSPLEEK